MINLGIDTRGTNSVIRDIFYPHLSFFVFHFAKKKNVKSMATFEAYI